MLSVQSQQVLNVSLSSSQSRSEDLSLQASKERNPRRLGEVAIWIDQEESHELPSSSNGINKSRLKVINLRHSSEISTAKMMALVNGQLQKQARTQLLQELYQTNVASEQVKGQHLEKN